MTLCYIMLLVILQIMISVIRQHRCCNVGGRRVSRYNARWHCIKQVVILQNMVSMPSDSIDAAMSQDLQRAEAAGQAARHAAVAALRFERTAWSRQRALLAAAAEAAAERQAAAPAVPPLWRPHVTRWASGPGAAPQAVEFVPLDLSGHGALIDRLRTSQESDTGT